MRCNSSGSAEQAEESVLLVPLTKVVLEAGLLWEKGSEWGSPQSPGEFFQYLK